jgi:CRISPR-associated protein Cmr6
MSSRRDALANLQPGAAQHGGLWLDKYIDGYEKLPAGDPQQGRLVRETCAIPEPEGYALFFQRWLRALQAHERVQIRYAHALGRLAIGLGAESVLETSIALQRAYGLPYLPGSALKGLAAAYAHQRLADPRWRKEVQTTADREGAPQGDAHKIIFGDTRTAGHVTFFDALYVPGSGHDGRALWPDVLTVHHQDYYQQSGPKLSPPADWDSPNPVPFITATGRYLVAVSGPPAWATLALEILAKALGDLGIGAKTSSGYGPRLTPAHAPARRRHEQRPEQSRAASQRWARSSPAR